MSVDNSERLQRAQNSLPAAVRDTAAAEWQRIDAIADTASLELWPDIAVTQLLRLIVSSSFAAGVIARHWDWIDNHVRSGAFDGPAIVDVDFPSGDEQSFAKSLRVHRHRQALHILWRSVNGQADTGETLGQLSALADELIIAARDYASAQLATRFGHALDGNGNPMSLLIIAMGKLGGCELNFSSDIDLIFLYPEEGETDGKRSLTATEYFTRLARRTVRLLDDVTEDGFVYRVDTRLRPFGDSGALAVSLSSLESYLLSHGRDWERYAYVKARAIGIAGHATDTLYRDTVIPFVYRRYLDYGVFESLREMKALISADVRKRERAENLKLGPGGIREIEFIVQSLQLVSGGRIDRLREQNLQAALAAIVEHELLPAQIGDELAAAYVFLRRLENSVQALRDQQIHDIPNSIDDRRRLAVAMGNDGWQQLEADLAQHRQTVTQHFREVVFRSGDEGPRDNPTNDITAAWHASTDLAGWQTLLRARAIEPADKIAEILSDFGRRMNKAPLDDAAQKRVAQLVPSMLLGAVDRSDPAVVVQRVIDIVESVARRSAYIALLNENPIVLHRLFDVCEQSAYLAREIARNPSLIDEMLDPRLFSGGIDGGELYREIARRLKQCADDDSERRVEILAQFQRATMFRIAIADFSGELAMMKVSDALTELAEVVIAAALRIAWGDLTARYGVPQLLNSSDSQRAGFCVVAYGKLGGIELSYGSDLDLVFLHDSPDSAQQTSGPTVIPNSLFFSRLVRRLVHFLTIQTASGAMYEVDTRLRPSGRSGLLVTTTDAFERYQQENAWTWEHQALLRGRPVAGTMSVRREFYRIRAETLQQRVARDELVGDVRDMRRRMRQELDKSNDQQFDLKQGAGGIGDIEFLVQYLVLRDGHQHRALIYYPDNIRQLGTLAATGCLSGADVSRLQHIYRQYRGKLHRLALDSRPPYVASQTFSAERQFVTSLWQREIG